MGREPQEQVAKAVAGDALLMQMSFVRPGRLLKGKWDWPGQTAREDGR